MSGPVLSADPGLARPEPASWLLAAMDYLWPWNLLLLLAYLTLWYSTSTRDIVQLRLFGAVASGLFVLFGLVALIWPMVAFNFLFLVMQLRRLIELHRPSDQLAASTPTQVVPVRAGPVQPTTGTCPTLGHAGRGNARLSTIVHYTDQPTRRLHHPADAPGPSAAEPDQATENLVLRKLLAEALAGQLVAERDGLSEWRRGGRPA